MYYCLLVVDLLSFLLDVLDVLLYFQLLFSALEGIREEKFAIQTSDLLGILEKLGIGLGEFFFFEFLLEFALLLIDPPSLELLLLELFVPLLLLSLLQILKVIRPLVSPLLTLLIEICGLVLLAIRCIDKDIRLGIKLARIFILISSSWVIVIPALEVIKKLYF